MLTMRLDEARSNFFDRPKVMRAVAEAGRANLSRFGAFVRTRSRTSIRPRKRVSSPGDPPSSHAGQLRDLIYFAWDGGTRSVVIGPVPFRQGKAPWLLEYGGETTAPLGGKAVLMRYRARPYMGPAFREELKQAPELWRNSIRGAA